MEQTWWRKVGCVTTTCRLAIPTKSTRHCCAEIENVKKFHITNGAAIVMDPKTGQILAMVGSKDYFAQDYDGQFNVV